MKEKKNKPLVRYDPSSDVLYIAIRKGVEEEFTEVAPGVNVEMDDRGNVLGVEILRASHTLKGFLKSLGKNAMRPNGRRQRAAYIPSSDHFIRSTAPPTTSTKAITKSPSHFGFWILRPGSPRQARGLSLSKAVQVLGCRLAEQEKPNRIRNVLFMYFFLNRFMVSRTQFRFEPETRNLKTF